MTEIVSLPVRGRGLKHATGAGCRVRLESLPVRGRGLKLAQQRALLLAQMSLPVRGRGLKPGGSIRRGRAPGRSPCGGVD